MVSPALPQCNLRKPPLERLKVQRRERVFSAIPIEFNSEFRCGCNELLEAAPLFFGLAHSVLYQDKAKLLRSHSRICGPENFSANLVQLDVTDCSLDVQHLLHS